MKKIQSLQRRLASIKVLFTSPHVPHYGTFLFSILFFSLSLGLFRGIQDSYLANILNVSRSGRGLVEFFRELPGLFLFVLLALFYRVSEKYLVRIALLFSLAGIFTIVLAETGIVFVVMGITVWSIGEHLLMPVSQSFAMHSAKKGLEGRALGFLRSLENIGKLLGLSMVPFVFLVSKTLKKKGANEASMAGLPEFRFVYWLIIGSLLVALFFALRLSGRGEKVKRERLYFHRKFSKYYGLEIFYGARKQIFLTFAPYMLVLNYGVSVGYIATLLGISSLINIGFTPLLGRLIDHKGYKKVMIYDTIILFFLCLLYGFAQRIFSINIALTVVSVTFILDWMLSNASMATSVYVGKISTDKKELTATLSTGISVNHMVSVIIVLLGGFIWERLGVELLFILAGVMALGNTLFAMSIPSLRRPDAKRAT